MGAVAAPLVTVSHDLPVTCSPRVQEYHTNSKDASKVTQGKRFILPKEKNHETYFQNSIFVYTELNQDIMILLVNIRKHVISA